MGQDSSHLCTSNKTVRQRRWTQGKKWFLFARGLPQLLQFLLFQTEPFRKYQHNDFKMGGEKKKVAEASSNLLKFSDTSS